MEITRSEYLFNQYQLNRLSKNEEQEWIDLLADPANENDIDRLAHTIFQREDLLKFQLNGSRANEILKSILSQPQLGQNKSLSLWRKLAAAAAIIVICTTSILFYSKRSKHEVINYAQDVAPGKTGATLTLSNGKKIILEGAANGLIAKESGMYVQKGMNGQLVYASGNEKNVSSNGESLNTLTTAKGQTYQVRLPDGSLVVLNAASSLTYNVSQIKKGKRMVKLEGEGYFEIAKDRSHPFIVKTNRQDVEVLGTHFNVNAYGDEGLEKTTLLKGSVRMTAEGKSKILKVGQQGILRPQNILISDIDTELAVAWKNNEFIFESESIETVMKMVERWYNLEIVYVGDKTDEKFSGRVSRFDHVSKLLRVIESTGYVHFKVEAQKIYVYQS